MCGFWCVCVGGVKQKTRLSQTLVFELCSIETYKLASILEQFLIEKVDGVYKRWIKYY